MNHIGCIVGMLACVREGCVDPYSVLTITLCKIVQLESNRPWVWTLNRIAILLQLIIIKHLYFSIWKADVMKQHSKIFCGCYRKWLLISSLHFCILCKFYSLQLLHVKHFCQYYRKQQKLVFSVLNPDYIGDARNRRIEGNLGWILHRKDNTVTTYVPQSRIILDPYLSIITPRIMVTPLRRLDPMEK